MLCGRIGGGGSGGGDGCCRACGRGAVRTHAAACEDEELLSARAAAEDGVPFGRRKSSRRSSPDLSALRVSRAPRAPRTTSVSAAQARMAAAGSPRAARSGGDDAEEELLSRTRGARR